MSTTRSTSNLHEKVYMEISQTHSKAPGFLACLCSLDTTQIRPCILPAIHEDYPALPSPIQEPS